MSGRASRIKQKKWVYLSPHLDDAVLSCGGLISQQVKRGDHVQIWTICAGDPPEDVPVFARQLHQRWEVGFDATVVRREEDERACRRLGASFRHMPFVDAIYRCFPGGGGYVINQNEDLFKPFDHRERPLVEELHSVLKEILPAGALLVLPLTVGGHVDHQLTRLAGENITPSTYYYAEYPYANCEKLIGGGLITQDWHEYSYQVDEISLRDWQEAVQAYTSQLSTFWDSIESMYCAVRNYWQCGGGSTLWFREA